MVAPAVPNPEGLVVGSAVPLLEASALLRVRVLECVESTCGLDHKLKGSVEEADTGLTVGKFANADGCGGGGGCGGGSANMAMISLLGAA